MKRLTLLALTLLLAGCPKKDDAATADAAAATPTAAATTPAPAETSTPAAVVAGGQTPGNGAGVAPADVPGVSSDPNKAPSNEEHEISASTAVQKSNYKAELDKLEKEDLSADTK